MSTKNPNKAIHFCDGVTVIALEHKDGSVLPCFIDTADWELVKDYRWCAAKAHNILYASTHLRRAEGKRKTLGMHSLLLSDTKLVDHEDRNGLNNRRLNIRAATYSQNNANRGKNKNGCTSQYRGVNWCKDKRKFRAGIVVNRKIIHLGMFVSEEEAALAYNASALQHFGAFASLNDVAVATELKKAA